MIGGPAADNGVIGGPAADINKKGPAAPTATHMCRDKACKAVLYLVDRRVTFALYTLYDFATSPKKYSILFRPPGTGPAQLAIFVTPPIFFRRNRDLGTISVYIEYDYIRCLSTPPCAYMVWICILPAN